MSAGRIISIILGILWIIFTIWLITVFATIAVSWRIASVVAWILIIALGVWLIRKFFFD